MCRMYPKLYTPCVFSVSSTDRRFRLARLWSNRQLRFIAPYCRGAVVNVSAGDDIDKEGATYASYFLHAESYTLTNYAPGAFRGFQGRSDEVLLDLTQEVPEKLRGTFDVVFNHTTLEHIFPIREAFAHLCSLSRDLVIVVVPFCQEQHENDGYRDYWRFTPTCLRTLFAAEGFSVVYEAANNQRNAAVYLFVVASRQPERWKNVLPSWKPVTHAAGWVGAPAIVIPYPRMLQAAVRRVRSWVRRS